MKRTAKSTSPKTRAKPPDTGTDLGKRDLIKSTVTASIAGLLPAGLLAAGQAQAEQPGSGSPVIDAGLKKFADDLEKVTHAIRSAPYYGRTERIKAGGEFYIRQVANQALAMALLPRQSFPVFYRETFLHPFTYNSMGPHPDGSYQLAFIDGSKDYRLWGRRNGSETVLLQMNKEYWVNDSTLVANKSLDEFDIDDDGNFEVILSHKPQGRNWIPLDPGSKNNALLIRNIMQDWSDRPAEFNIEPVDLQTALEDDLHLTQEEIARRIAYAGDMIRDVTDSMTIGIIKTVLRQTNGKVNELAFQSGQAWLAQGGSPDAIYGRCIFDIREDQALIIESDVPKGRYVSYCTSDIWLQQPDFIYHQSSLNRKQMQLDADGKVRIVVSIKDPGVHNWLDTLGNTYGRVIYRGYITEREPQVKCTLVPLDDLERHLPADTRKVSKQERAEILRKRGRGGLKFYGY
ncbi:MAG: DUF1214 domain-containing protein [Gammaproteobacteria bacterium]